ncbi:MAG: hypothetical protein JSW63_03610 [Ignavibacterium sp.]|nr:MAG: hypothetical protein JSW63_03610 [Ignavibacterium sp.]
MGTQQLLLVVLGIFVVSVAIALASGLFGTHAEEAAKDNIASECVTIGQLAQQYYAKEREMGGGSKSFVGWEISSHLDSTSSGIYTISARNNTQLILVGKPHPSKGYNWIVQSVITKNNILSNILYSN